MGRQNATVSNQFGRSDMQQQADRSVWQVIAAKRFPLSGACGNIRGDGKYALVSKCFHRWKVLLYSTPEDRGAAGERWFDKQTCGAPNCRGEHQQVNLSL
jgi:hypothetical protein